MVRDNIADVCPHENPQGRVGSKAVGIHVQLELCCDPAAGYRLEGPHEATQLAASDPAGGAAERTDGGGAENTQQPTVVSPGHRFNQVHIVFGAMLRQCSMMPHDLALSEGMLNHLFNLICCRMRWCLIHTQRPSSDGDDLAIWGQ